jgi:hypothetical protein
MGNVALIGSPFPKSWRPRVGIVRAAGRHVGTHDNLINTPMDRLRTSGDAVKSRRPPFKERDDVALAPPVFVSGSERELPAGAGGTVVGVWRGGEASEVEFTTPFACVVTVRAEGLAA